MVVRRLGGHEIFEPGDGRDVAAGGHQGRAELAQGEAPFVDRRWAERPDRPGVEPSLAGEPVEPGLGVGLERGRERLERQHVTLAAGRRREPLLRPARHPLHRRVPGNHRPPPAVARVLVEAVLHQRRAEAVHRRLVEMLGIDALGRGPAHQPREHPPVLQRRRERRPGRGKGMQPSPRHDGETGTLQRGQQEAARIGPAGWADTCCRRHGLADQPAKQRRVGRQLVRAVPEHPTDRPDSRRHLAAPARVGLGALEGRDHRREGGGGRGRERGCRRPSCRAIVVTPVDS